MWDHRRLEELIDLQPSTHVRIEAGGSQVKTIRVALTPHRIEESVTVNRFATLKPSDRSISALVNFDCDDLLS
jgi:hypothetical protein